MSQLGRYSGGFSGVLENSRFIVEPAHFSLVVPSYSLSLSW